MSWRYACVLIALAAVGAAVIGFGLRAPATQPAGPLGRADAPSAATAPSTQAAAVPDARAKAIDAEHLARAQADVKEGITWLLARRNDDGGWGFTPGRSHPALTAMAVKALLQSGDYDNDSPAVAKAFKVIMKLRQADGGFYEPAEGNANYITSVVVMALAAAKDPRHSDALEGAIKFLRGRQIVPGSKTPDGETVTAEHPYVGGVSYGEDGRPDLSNLGFWMEAMHEAGVSGDDEAMQRALAFVKRLQNRTEGTEDQAFVVRGDNDGGFVYALSKEGERFVGESKAGQTRRGLRSYGSMTYTGFKSMLYANVAKDDPRVKAAYEWIRKYWRLDSNPNMPEAASMQGLFYYYHVFAKGLRAWGRDVIEDTRGVKHNWRHELIDTLHDKQADDGSWANPEKRWFESNPVLATGYAVLALQEALRQ